MASVTQRVPNYLGGVSKQPDDKKFPGQVREALNAYPDPTFGLQKRPGLKFITTLKDGGGDDAGTDGSDFDATDLDTGKWFYIHRDNDEKYIGCILGNATASDAKIHIWNAATKVKATLTYSGSSRDYLSAVTKNDYHVLTVQDTSIITNKQKTVAIQANPTFNLKRNATIRLLGIDYSAPYQTVITIGGSDYTCSYTNTSSGTADTVLTGIKAAIDAKSLSGLVVTKLNTSLEITYTGDFTLTVQGGIDGKQLSTYQDSVNNISDLPDESKHDRVIKIINTSSSLDDYYAKFVADAGSGTGQGHWEETLGHGMSVGLDAATMPHELVNTGTNAFTFRAITWTARLVGDDSTNSHPSFNGEKIQQAFFYNNRLGFLSEDNVSMSQSGEFYNFYHITAQTVSASDPVDLNCSSIRPAVLHGIIPVASGLILFSENQQFIMYAADGNLSPQTAIIRGLSNYEMDTNIDPVDVGTNINFVSKTPAYTRVFGLTPRGEGQIPDVTNLGKVVDEYIPDTVDSLIASPQNSFIALYGSTLDTVYFYRTHAEGNQQVLQAWFSWKLPGKVHHFVVDSDVVYTIVKVTTATNTFRYTLLSANLSATAEDEVITTTDGIKINPYMDLYSKAGNAGATHTVTYDTTTGDSKCYIPYTDITSATPIITIAGDAAANFTTDVPTGLVITPTRGSDGNGPYFLAENIDLSANDVKTKVIVGYTFDYDITLPKTYFQLDRGISDYTSKLTIARMKLSVGRSSTVGFKMSANGLRGKYKDFEGDGSTTVFTLPFEVDDKSDIKIKLDGTNTSDFTIEAPGSVTIDGSAVEVPIKVTMGSAPATMTFHNIASGNGTGYSNANGVATTGGSGTGLTLNLTTSGGAVTAVTVAEKGSGYKPEEVITISGGGGNAKVTIKTLPVQITIYEDNWYDIQPVQEANQYLASDVPFIDQAVYTIPVHQRTENFLLRVFSDSPFPVSLTSMMWEGNYTPRYYRRT
jgi:hypothetical protein